MSKATGIQWTDWTWNPIAGCFTASPGCANCYAARSAWRMSHHGNDKISGKGEGTAKLAANGEPVWTGLVRLAEHTLTEPLKARKPMRIFANSMSDLFFSALSDEQIARIWAVMALAYWHDFQVLTKRAERMRDWLRNPGTPALVTAEMVRLDPTATLPAWPLPNIWVGVSIESQSWADQRLPVLLDCPAAIRFLSAEPLLGQVDLELALRRSGASSNLGAAGLHWVISGGESGKRARPMHPDWLRLLRDQCAGAGIAYFVKQRGEWSWNFEANDSREARAIMPDGTAVPVGTLGSQTIVKVGTVEAGDVLDEVRWQDFPRVPVPLSARKARKQERGGSEVVPLRDLFEWQPAAFTATPASADGPVLPLRQGRQVPEP